MSFALSGGGMKIAWRFFAALSIASLGALALLESPSAFAGGWSGGGGGGSGVACFNAREDADRARQARARRRVLPRDLIAKMSSLVVTDLWERPVKQGAKYAPLPGEESSAYLERVLSQTFASTSPVFIQRVKGALQRASLNYDQSIDGAGGLLPVNDLGSLARDVDSALEGRCALVQIVVRHAEPEKKGEIRSAIEIDRDLFERLGMIDSRVDPVQRVLNQAVLRLHEALYLMGFGLGHKTSEKIRRLSTLLISGEFDLEVSRIAEGMLASYKYGTLEGSRSVALIQLLLLHGFESFPLFEASSRLTVKRELMEAFAELLRLQDRIRIELGLGAEGYVSEAQKDRARVQAKAMLRELNPAQAFMQFAWMLTAEGKLKDIYLLVDPARDSRAELASVCRQARDESRRVPADIVYRRTAFYCIGLMRK